MKLLKKYKFFFTISFFVLLIITVPYVYASVSGGEYFKFNGFLLNPLDGNTYLAKMYQGWAGNWQFKLPYTPEPGTGVYLFLFYLSLGHLARVLNLPLLLVFHGVRILSSILMLISLWGFYCSLFDSKRVQMLSFGFGALGSGMGWLLVPFGYFTADFWVAETFPFLSSYSNPHFPLGLAMVLWLVKPRNDFHLSWKKALIFAVVVWILSIINPFGVVVSLMVMIGQLIWKLRTRSNPKYIIMISMIIAIFGLPMLVYANWISKSHPVLKMWNEQNLTPSPDLWDLAISLSPALVVSIYGMISWAKSRSSEPNQRVSILVFWVLLGTISIYLPVSLQRRFMMGLFVPIAGLSAYGVENLSKNYPGSFRFVTIVLILLSLPTNFLILMAANSGIQGLNPQIYLSSSEFQALTWIKENTNSDDLILSSPDMGLFIPAYTGRHVIYGHPYETAHAEQQEKVVMEIYQGSYSSEQLKGYIQTQGLDYIFWGPREEEIGVPFVQPEWTLVFNKDDVSIYRVHP